MKFYAIILFALIVSSCNKVDIVENKIEALLEQRASTVSLPPFWYNKPLMYNDGKITTTELLNFMSSTRSKILVKYGIDVYATLSPNDANIAILGLILPAIEYYAGLGIILEMESFPSTVSTLNNQAKIINYYVLDRDVVGCAADALGLGAFAGVASGLGASAIAKRAISGVIKGMARAAVPVVGFAVTALSFGCCMGWWCN